MPASTERSPWDFSSVYELLDNLSTQDAVPEYNGDLKLRPRGLSNSTRQSTGLGDLGPVWQFLYAGKERPPESAATLASSLDGATDAYLQRTLEAATLPPPLREETYNSDGAADSTERKNVTWKEEPEVLEPSDEAATPTTPTTSKYELPPVEATKEQRKRFWRNMLLTQAMSRQDIRMAKKLERAERQKLDEQSHSVRKTKSDVESESEIRILKRPTPAKKASIHSRPETPNRERPSSPRYILRSSGNLPGTQIEPRPRSPAKVANQEVAVDISLAKFQSLSNGFLGKERFVPEAQQENTPTPSRKKKIKPKNGKDHELTGNPLHPETTAVRQLEPSADIIDSPALTSELPTAPLGMKARPSVLTPRKHVGQSNPSTAIGQHDALGIQHSDPPVKAQVEAQSPLRPAAVSSKLELSTSDSEHAHPYLQKLVTPVEVNAKIADINQSTTIVHENTHLTATPKKGKQPVNSAISPKDEKSIANGTLQSTPQAKNTSLEQLPKYLEALSPKKKGSVDLTISSFQPALGLPQPFHQIPVQFLPPSRKMVPSQVKQTTRDRQFVPPISHKPSAVYSAEQIQRNAEQQAWYKQHHMQHLPPQPQIIPNPHTNPPPFTTSTYPSAPYLRDILQQSSTSLTNPFSKKSKSFNILPKEDRDLHLFLRLVHEFPADKKWLTKPVHLVDHTASPSGKLSGNLHSSL
jgi:hypothetical protein